MPTALRKKKSKKAVTKGRKKSAPAAGKKKSPHLIPTADAVDELYDRLAKQPTAVRGSGIYVSLPSKPGETVIRILPFLDTRGRAQVFQDQANHWNVDPAQESSRIPCTGGGCPICEIIDSGMLPEEIAKAIGARHSYQLNCIIRESDTLEGTGFKVLRVPQTCMEKLREALVMGAAYANPLDLKKGRDFTIIVGKRGAVPSYAVKVAQRLTPVGADVEPYQLDRNPVTLPENYHELVNAVREQVR